MALLKWIGIIVGSILLILALLLVLLQWDVGRDYAARQLSQMTGRRLTIAGPWDIDWSLTPRLRAERIRLENAPWSREPYMLELAVLELRIDLMALLTGRLVLPEVTLIRPRVVLEISSRGEPNWKFTTTPPAEVVTEATVPEERAEFPTVRRLLIEDGRVVYRDLPGATDLEATLTTIRGRSGEETLQLQGRGRLEGDAIHIDAQGGSVLQLRATEAPYPVMLHLRTASTTLRVDGSMRQPLQLQGLDLAVDVQGQGRVALLAAAGILPPTLPPYRLQARLSQHDNLWSLDELRASLGQSDLAGKATLEVRETRPLLQASLMSHILDMVQLQDVLQTDSTQVARQQDDAPTVIDVQPLRELDASITWQVEKLIVPQGTFDDVTLHVALHDGRLCLDPLQVALGDGTARIQAAVDAGSGAPQGSLQVTFEQASAARVSAMLGMETAQTGTLDGTLHLALAPDADPDAPLTPSSLLQRLQVEDSNLSYRDAATQSEVNATIRQERSNGRPVIKLAGQGRYQHQEVAFEAEADALARLADQEQAYTIAADASMQDTRAQVNMRLGDPSAAGDMTMQVALQGGSSANLSSLLGTSLPALSDLQLEGNIRYTGNTWSMEQVSFTAAGIDLQGGMAISTGGERPLIRADLVLDELHVQQLLDALADDAAVASASTNGVATSTAVDPAPLRAVDADIRIRASRIEAPHVPLRDVTIHASLRDGRLRVKPLTLHTHDGQIAAEIRLDATARPLQGTMRSTITQLDLGKVLQPFVATEQPLGRLSGTLNLAATGIDPGGSGNDVIMPFLGRLAIVESQLAYTDQAHGIDVRASIDTEELENETQVVHIEAKGKYKQEPFTLRFRGDPLLTLREPEDPYTLNATINAVQTEAHVEGRVTDPLALRGVDVRLTLAGPNPQFLSPVLGFPLPPLPPYSVQGRLLRQHPTTWKFLGFAGRVGDSDLAGDIEVDTQGERPVVQADLDSRLIDFDDLGPLVGAAPEAEPGETASPEQAREKAEQETSPTVLPRAPINFDNLRWLDASIKLRGKRIETNLPLDDLTANITIRAGKLTMTPLDFGVASGSVHSRIELDTDAQPTRTIFDIEIRHIRLKEIVRRFDIADESVGLIGGRAKVWVEGNSVADMLASADGGLLLLMTGGEFDDLLVELAGLDVGEALAALLGDDRDKFSINCAFVDMHARKGVAQLKSFVVDTDDTLFLGKGTIDLSQERLDLVIDPKPKDLSLFSARAPLYIQGSFADPNVRAGQSAIIRGAASLAMLPAAPLAALIPLLDPEDDDQAGEARESVYCSGLVEAINKAR